MHFIKSVKSTTRIVRLKDDRKGEQTDDGRLFHTLTTRSTKKLLRTLLVHTWFKQCTSLWSVSFCRTVHVTANKIRKTHWVAYQCFRPRFRLKLVFKTCCNPKDKMMLKKELQNLRRDKVVSD